MEEISKKINFSKSGTGGYTPRLNLKTEWLKNMGISKEENEVLIKYNEETQEIIIKKK